MRLINPQDDQPIKNKNVKSWSESKAYSAELSVYVTHDGILNRNITCSLAKQDLGTDLKLMIRDMPPADEEHGVQHDQHQQVRELWQSYLAAAAGQALAEPVVGQTLRIKLNVAPVNRTLHYPSPNQPNLNINPIPTPTQP